jgi:hypothetical protein
MTEEHIFVIGFCRQYVTVLDPKLASFTDEAWFHLSGSISAQKNRYWSSIILRQALEVPLNNQKICV